MIFDAKAAATELADALAREGWALQSSAIRIIERHLDMAHRAGVADEQPRRPVLTTRQMHVHRYVCDFIAEHGQAPTLREIGAALQLRSTASVSEHLGALEQKGYIERDECGPRGIRIIGPALAQN
jgi:DNA-binding MarR family transcriptional regulator